MTDPKIEDGGFEESGGESETLGDALPRELARCRELLTAYKEVGPPGRFASEMIAADIEFGEKALAENDVTGMVAAYAALKEYN